LEIVSLKSCNQNIIKTLELVEEMIDLSNSGDIHRDDVGCGILYGILRDSAYRIKKIAEAEKKSHMEKGKWD
jgi:hypothetical protein